MIIAKQDLIDALVYHCPFYVHNGAFSYCSMNGDRTNCVSDKCTQVTDFFNTLAKLRKKEIEIL